MPFSHHSHSGQFCPGHARNSLEEMLRTAIARRMSVFAVTEHMPRHAKDFYAEECAAGFTFADQVANERAYFAEAIRLRERYRTQISVPVGFESEWVQQDRSMEMIEHSLSSYGFDFFVGSVHHVRALPIDYTSEDYGRARDAAGGSDERLFEDYFDAQFAMLSALRPPVVGHLDLIRLMSEEPNAAWQPRWKGVWQRVVRNLVFIRDYGGLVELNFSALRKGLHEPYPKGEICRALVEMGGRFCLSDDSHGVEQVALNYDKLLPFLDEVGIKQLYFLGHADERQDSPLDVRFPYLVIDAIGVDELKDHVFWTVNRET